jgi:hypothetical protein
VKIPEVYKFDWRQKNLASLLAIWCSIEVREQSLGLQK